LCGEKNFGLNNKIIELKSKQSASVKSNEGLMLYRIEISAGKIADINASFYSRLKGLRKNNGGHYDHWYDD
jgi:hypothetical protein